MVVWACLQFQRGFEIHLGEEGLVEAIVRDAVITDFMFAIRGAVLKGVILLIEKCWAMKVVLKLIAGCGDSRGLERTFVRLGSSNLTLIGYSRQSSPFFWRSSIQRLSF